MEGHEFASSALASDLEKTESGREMALPVVKLEGKKHGSHSKPKEPFTGPTSLEPMRRVRQLRGKHRGE